MFIKQGMFRKLLKKAYQDDFLRVGASTEDLYIYGSYWAIKIKRSKLTNQEKAALVEFCGELPEAGIFWKVQKEGNQAEMPIDRLLKVLENAKMHRVPGQVTPFAYKDYAIVQHRRGDMLIKAAIEESISGAHVQKEKGENGPEGPYMAEDMQGAYWRNNVMIFYLAKGVMKNTDFISKIHELDLMEAEIGND